MVTTLSPSSHCFTIYMLGLVFRRTFGTFIAHSSYSAVLTIIHGPLRLRRSKHYQPPPSLQWQLSSSGMPGFQPLPPPALSLLFFAVLKKPPAQHIQHPSCSLSREYAVCMWNVHWPETKTSCLCIYVGWCKNIHCWPTAWRWSCGWGACCILKELIVCSLLRKLFVALVVHLLI